MKLNDLPQWEKRKIISEWKSDQDGSEIVLSLIEQEELKTDHVATVEMHYFSDGRTRYERITLTSDDWSAIGREMGWSK